MAYVHAVSEAQEGREFQYCLAILLQQGFETFFIDRRCFAAMIAHKVGNDILLAFTKSDEMIGGEQILSVFIMVNAIDEMTKVV